MRTNTVWENNNLSVSLAVSKNLSIFTSTRACGDLDTNVWRQANNYVWKCETKQSF